LFLEAKTRNLIQEEVTAMPAFNAYLWKTYACVMPQLAAKENCLDKGLYGLDH